MDRFLTLAGRRIRRSFRVLPYERLLKMRRAPVGAYIFSDIERLDRSESLAAARVWERIAAAGGGENVLNHPTRSMRRYELLRTLRELGRNDFDAYRLTEHRRPRRYPVILRDEIDHGEVDPDLAPDEAVLRDAVTRWERKGRDRDRTLVVEFCDTRRGDRIYRKYAAFLVGGVLIPRHVFFGANWNVHLDEGLQAQPGHAEEERRYLEDNPHADQLREIFAIADIQYGRVDYGVLDGRIQTWEINTNPTIFFPAQPGARRHPIDMTFLPPFCEALGRVEGAAPSRGTVRLREAWPATFRRRVRSLGGRAKHVLRRRPRRAR